MFSNYTLLKRSLKEAELTEHAHFDCPYYDDCLFEICIEHPKANGWSCARCALIKINFPPAGLDGYRMNPNWDV